VTVLPRQDTTQHDFELLDGVSGNDLRSTFAGHQPFNLSAGTFHPLASDLSRHDTSLAHLSGHGNSAESQQNPPELWSSFSSTTTTLTDMSHTQPRSNFGQPSNHEISASHQCPSVFSNIWDHAMPEGPNELHQQGWPEISVTSEAGREADSGHETAISDREAHNTADQIPLHRTSEPSLQFQQKSHSSVQTTAHIDGVDRQKSNPNKLVGHITGQSSEKQSSGNRLPIWPQSPQAEGLETQSFRIAGADSANSFFSPDIMDFVDFTDTPMPST